MLPPKSYLITAVFLFMLLGAHTLPSNGAAYTAKLDRNLIDQGMAQARELPRLRSLLISLDGEIVEERYYHGARANQTANLKSVSKSILSALVGIALHRGYLTTVQEPIGSYFTEMLSDNGDARKKAITIEDLLTMRSGLESTSNVNYGRWVQSGHWVRHILTRPLVDEPGARMIYSTGNSHLLSALLTRASKASTYDFARGYLAEPLGYPLSPWVRDPQGIYLGGNEMHWTPRAMLAFGELYQNAGRAGGRQILSESWVREFLKPRTRSRWGRDYGYGWWSDELGGQRSFYAWGHGGQFIFLVPELKLTVAATALPTPGEGRREHQRAIYALMDRYIIPAAAWGRSGEPKPASLSRHESFLDAID